MHILNDIEYAIHSDCPKNSNGDYSSDNENCYGKGSSDSTMPEAELDCRWRGGTLAAPSTESSRTKLMEAVADENRWSGIFWDTTRNKFR